MTEHDQARAALKKLGILNVDNLSDAEVEKHISTLIGSVVAFSGSLALSYKLSVEGIVAIFRAFSEVLTPESTDPVSEIVERLAR